ncbi:hypothetical protein FOQG_10363 [Fusarium oxysporum f. sp. raphani 54005]|uniref:Uncharacterized protein n=3 Tax=Fusarium oxysporum TaxID=5507 RepID=X0CSS5_FUSOX|nr:hypothetical protein FOMG_18317 [Fusarium oxysporum f. sp. melonis 26406]EXK85567.1 hypothetical protein FOQG_10363 [Fusarium oxysporum f. sp. raphani 54005]
MPKLTSDFLIAWFLYYDVLANFTQPAQKNSITEEQYLVRMLDISKIDTSAIVGSLGCSVELFEAIHHINHLHAFCKGHIPWLVTSTVLQRRIELGSQLRHLVQHLDPDEEKIATAPRRTQALATAELYRLAALLYLQRIYPIHEDDGSRITHLEEGFCALETLSVASSPWPVFILACESQTETQRITILRRLDDMESMRGIGNILVMRDIIEKVWKQNDLRQTTNPGEQFSWCQFVESGNAVPWFV